MLNTVTTVFLYTERLERLKLLVKCSFVPCGKISVKESYLDATNQICKYYLNNPCILIVFNFHNAE